VSRAFIGMGSNMEDRLEHLKAGIGALAAAAPDVIIVSKSSVYGSAPVGMTDQPDFLNAVVAVETTFDPYELLSLLHEIESERGRKRIAHWGPRTLDLDILMFGDLEQDDPRLTLPHPRLTERCFALAPLLEIDPAAALPDGTPLQSAREKLGDAQGVWRVGDLMTPAADRTETIAVIGAGKVGTAIARALSTKGYRVVAVADLKKDARERAASLAGSRPFESCVEAAARADVVIITTPDGAIEGVCGDISGSNASLVGKKFIHMSGALPLAALETAASRGADTLSIHPIATFADLMSAERFLPGSAFGVTCDLALLPWARDFVSAMGGRTLVVADGDKVLYHSAAVVACNLLAMVSYGAYVIARRLGFRDEETSQAFGPLAAATVENVSALGPASALTGPLARGDIGTIRAHIDVLEKFDPGLAEMYRAVSLWGLRLTEECGELDMGVIEQMKEILNRGQATSTAQR